MFDRLFTELLRTNDAWGSVCVKSFNYSWAGDVQDLLGTTSRDLNQCPFLRLLHDKHYGAALH